MPNIGDMNTKTPNGTALWIRNGFERNRIIEVARIGWIDGEDKALAKVAIPLAQRAFNIKFRIASLLERSFRKRSLELMTPDDEVDRNALVIGFTQDLLDDSRRCAVPCGERSDADADNRTVGNARRVLDLSEDVVIDARVFRNNDTERFSDLVTPDNDIVRTLNNGDDARKRFLARTRT